MVLDREDAARKAGSSGKPVLHTEVRIVRPDGSDAAVGELGELWVKGPNITPGYWNRPDANASSFTDGWLHTGDATRIDEEGFYYIVDRWKDMDTLFPAPVAANSANIGNATAFVSALQARGGTEMVPAMRAALSDTNHDDANYVRQVVFLTDGAIGNEQQLFETISALRGRSRVFMTIHRTPEPWSRPRAAATIRHRPRPRLSRRAAVLRGFRWPAGSTAPTRPSS